MLTMWKQASQRDAINRLLLRNPINQLTGIVHFSPGFSTQQTGQRLHSYIRMISKSPHAILALMCHAGAQSLLNALPLRVLVLTRLPCCLVAVSCKQPKSRRCDTCRRSRTHNNESPLEDRSSIRRNTPIPSALFDVLSSSKTIAGHTQDTQDPTKAWGRGSVTLWPGFGDFTSYKLIWLWLQLLLWLQYF